MLKPCLVMGSGFHRWVKGDRVIRDNDSPLSNWHVLIESVAELMAVSAPSVDFPPTLRWEKLLENAVNDGFKPVGATETILPFALQSHEVELHAKRAVAKILTDEYFQYPGHSARAKFPFRDMFGAVISLNFDHSWMDRFDRVLSPLPGSDSSNRSENVSGTENSRLKAYVLTKGPRRKDASDLCVWFPNGHVEWPESIRMGLYDYGTQAHALKQAFGHIKSFERQHHDAESASAEKWDAYFDRLAQEFARSIDDQDSRVANWVSHFLYRPLYFAGVGLSEQETGLWWLLAQRARNIARIVRSRRPETVILVNAQDPRRSFWSKRPFGIEPMFCDDWDIGWEMLGDRCERSLAG